MIRVIRMVQSATDPNKYNQRTSSQMNCMTTKLILEGADGDEESNTVTYWYRRAIPGEDE